MRDRLDATRPLAIIGVPLGVLLVLVTLAHPTIGFAAIVVLFPLLICIVWATLVIASPSAKQWTTHLTQSRAYSPLYQRAMRRVLHWPLGWFGQRRFKHYHRTGCQILSRSFNYGLVDRALLFAVAYPVILLLGFWIFSGADARLGSAIIIPADQTGGQRYLLLLLFAIMCAHPFFRTWALAHPKRYIRNISDGAWFLTVGWLFLILLFFDIEPFAVAGASLVAVAVAGASLVAVAGAGVVVVAGAVSKLTERRFFRSATVVALGAPAILVAVAVVGIDWSTSTERTRALILFLAVLPLLNALLDILSYGATLTLSQIGLKHGGWRALFCGIADAAIALVLFLALGAVLVCAVTLIENVTGIEWVDIGGLLANIGDVSTYWWVYAMVFSTVVPTMIHLIVACFALQTCAGSSVRTWIATQITRARATPDDLGPYVLGSLGLGTLWYLSVALPIAALSGLALVLWHFGLAAWAEIYLNWLLELSAWLGAI